MQTSFFTSRRFRSKYQKKTSKKFNQYQWRSHRFKSSRRFSLGHEYKSLIWPFIFTSAFSSGVFYIAHLFKTKDPNVIWIKEKLNQMKQPIIPYIPQSLWLSPEDKAVYTILGINTMIFVGWRLFPLFMLRHFISVSGDKRAYTLLTSSFSHADLWHYAFNMFAFYAFGKFLYRMLGKEDFYAFYLSSCVISGFTSRVFLTLTSQYSSSLGASGAIYSALSLVATVYPNSNFLLFFAIPIQASTLIPILFIFETLGIFGVWRRYLPVALDHASHLGGFFFGLFYAHYVYNKPTVKKSSIQAKKPYLKWN